MEKIVIIGGGASALMCACHIKNKDVTLFEMGEKIGKKILATGNGRCNLTNLNMNGYSYNQSLDKYFEKVSVGETMEFFNKIGLEFTVDDEGRVYPLSNTATSVLSVLKNNIELKKNVKIESNKEIIDVFYENNAYKLVFSDNSHQFFDKVIIASGNCTNLKIFDKFNIKYKNFTPSLCSLKTEKHKALSGVRVDDVCVKCNSNGINFEENGEVLFKDEGISGIVIFNLSSHMARINNYNNKIFIDYLPKVDESELFLILNERKEKLSSLACEDFLTGFFHKQVNNEILKRVNIKFELKVKDISTSQLKKIAYLIKNFELNTCGYYENNQVMSGGVLLNELNNNLECKKQKGLYFIGEVCDVDGVCGGYNLQWAWTSGQIVGESL